MRQARLYILVAPGDCDPPHGLDLSAGSRDSLKVEWLTEAFASSGFDKRFPCLVGYPSEGRIQLVSGTHRHEAARRAGIRLPVHMTLRSVVERIWGTDDWLAFLKDCAVEALERVEVPEGEIPGAMCLPTDPMFPASRFARLPEEVA